MPDDRDANPVENVTETSPEDERVAHLLAHSIDVPVLAEAVERQDAADAADTLEHLEEEDAADVLVAMDDAPAAEALAEMEEPLAAGVLDDLLDEGNAAYASRLLSLMAPDDAVDLLQALDGDQQDVLYGAMTLEGSVALRKLAGYHEESAGGLMTTDYLALNESDTVARAIEALRAASVPEEMHSLPVVDAQHRLMGVVSLRALLINAPEQLVGSLVAEAPKVIPIDLDQEDIAREFDRYDLFMLPVVDHERRLLGIVTVDDVIDIIRAEQTEDVQKTVGAGAGEAVYSGLATKLTGRFPWLVTSFFMTCAAAVVVLFFEDLIRDHPIVAFLMPVIAALVGNSGHQALAVTLRGIVLDEVRRSRIRPLIMREAMVGLVNGLGIGLLMILVVGALSLVSPMGGWGVGAVAGAALAVSMCAGTVAGSAIPLIMRRLGADPAQSSAIFLIMITDAVAFATFLGLAHLASSRW